MNHPNQRTLALYLFEAIWVPLNCSSGKLHSHSQFDRLLRNRQREKTILQPRALEVPVSQQIKDFLHKPSILDFKVSYLEGFIFQILLCCQS